MTRKQKDDDADLMRELDEGIKHELEQRDTPTVGEIPPGCSAPDQVSPSVVGTSHDPKRSKKED